MVRRKKSGYFEQPENAPAPITFKMKRRVQFNEADAMGIVWHGRYLIYFEEASAEMGRQTDLSYMDLNNANIQIPIVQAHIDYHKPLVVDELFEIEISRIWNDGARINTEYAIFKEDGSLAVSGYTVNMFINAKNKEVILILPEIVEEYRARWRAGKLLQGTGNS